VVILSIGASGLMIENYAEIMVMAKRLDQHKQRQEAVSLFGKNLVRRSGSACELCESTGTKLSVYEVPPVEDEPVFEHCIFICETCSGQLSQPKTIDSNHWRCLSKSVWSEIVPIQVISVAMLKRLEKDSDWAAEILEQLYLAEEIESWAAQVTI
jgi:protein PhnA